MASVIIIMAVAEDLVRPVEIEANATLVGMHEIAEKNISCPYCGEEISVLVDGSVPEQRYVEDCQVCCRPIVLDVSVDGEGDVVVGVRGENE